MEDVYPKGGVCNRCVIEFAEEPSICMGLYLTDISSECSFLAPQVKLAAKLTEV